MADGMTDAQLLDLIATTQSNVERGSLSVAMRYQRYIMADWFLAKGNFETQHSGKDLEREIVLKDAAPATHVRKWAKDNVQVTDVVDKLTIPWRHATGNFAFERREILENRSPARIVDLFKVRRMAAYQQIAEALESAGWQAPSSSSDDLSPHGIPYWIVPLDEAQNGAGFYGAGVTDGTSVHTLIHDKIGNIDPASSLDGTTAPAAATAAIRARWRNYCVGGTGYYTAIDETLMEQMALMFYELNWRSPDIVDEIQDRAKWQLRIYLAPKTLVKLERRAQQQNDALGADLHKYGGTTMFKRTPFVHVPYLKNDKLSDETTEAQSIWFVDHSTFKCRVLEGDYLRESDPAKDTERHNVVIIHVDLTYNYFTVARWTNGVLRKTA